MLPPAELASMMEVKVLAVISALGDLGNGECRDAAGDFGPGLHTMGCPILGRLSSGQHFGRIFTPAPHYLFGV